MSVTEINKALGSWSLRLRQDTPRSVLNALEYLGHIAVMPGRVNPIQYGDNLLDAARYVGVYRGKDAQNEFTIKGAGMAFWLGDEDGKGDVIESEVLLTAATFADAITAVLPPSGSIVAGTLVSPGGTYNGRHIYETSRSALTYITDVFGAEWRVNNNGTLDAGPIASLFVTVPKALLIRKGEGADLSYRVMPGTMAMGNDVEDYTTRVLLLAEGEGSTIATGSADAATVPFMDIHGNEVVLTRLVSESGTSPGNADARAQLMLNRFSGSRHSVSLSTSEYDVKGEFAVGDYLYVFDPDTGFVDGANEIQWQGAVINPMALRCVEMTWPVPVGWTVGFRRSTDGVWVDLSDYYIPESGETMIVVGEFNRSLTTSGGEPIGSRPNTGGVDSTIPNAPTFTGLSTGSYESEHSTRSAIRAQWTTPLNIDGSVITDGDHYEIQYRVNQAIGFAVDWADVDPLNWNDLNLTQVNDLNDTFGRTVVDGWGGVWTVAPSANAAAFDVTPGAATISIDTVNTTRRAHMLLDSEDQEVLREVSWAALPTGTGGHWESSVVTRYNSVTIDYYFGEVEITTTGAVRCRIVRKTNSPNEETPIGPAQVIISGMTYAPGNRLWIRMKSKGNVHRLKVWIGTAGDEPTLWHIIAADPFPLPASSMRAGTRDVVGPGTTSTLPVVVTTHSFQAWTPTPQRSWDALLSEPVSTDPQWQSVNVAFGTNTFTLVELTPSVNYELRIRAVDNATPPHLGTWSGSSFVFTAGDSIAPATPGPPEVASSRIAIQVTHRLGAASGGTFNLDLDLHHLEVHVGGSTSFFASEDTKVGELIANGSMVVGNIPAVGTFQVEQTEAIWVKVIAVDRAGNKSPASGAVQATADLIDDAHISNLSVSKVTAGTITATWLNAGRITTAETGARVELNGDGLTAIDGNGYVTARLDGTDTLLRFWQPPYLYHPVEIGKREDGGWGMRVQDLFGNTRLLVGQLDPAGSPGDPDNYGLAGVNSLGQIVKLSTIMFGQKEDTVANVSIPQQLAYGNGSTFGPQVTDIQIGSTGICLVTLSAEADFESSPADSSSSGHFAGHMGFSVVDQETGVEVLAPSDSRAAGFALEWPISTGNTAGTGGNFGYEAGISRTVQISLPPGVYTFTAKYRSIDHLISGSTAIFDFNNAQIVVQPR